MGLRRYERWETLLHPFHRKQRSPGIHGVSAETIDDYVAHTKHTPGLHPGAAGVTPSAQADHSRRGDWRSGLDKCG